MKTLIKNVKIICEDQILTDYNLIIENNKIFDVIKNNVNEKVEKVIDGEGKYLSPGFIDIHNHGNSGFDAMDGTLEAIEGIGKFHLTSGVTTFLATTMTASFDRTKEVISNVVNYIEETGKKSDRAKCDGLYLEGPYFSVEKCGAQPKQYIKAPDMGELSDYVELGNGLVKIVALAPENENAIEATKYLVKNDIVVSGGHSNANYEDTMKVFNAGAREVTHMYNGMRAFSHRDPGIIGAAMLDNRIACEMICDGIHIHDAAMRLLYKIKGKDKIILISDAMRAAGLDDGEYDLGGQNVFVKGYEARLANGALAGSTLTLNRAVKNMINLVNVPLVEAVRMATLNPARQIGIDDKVGSIKTGKIADLILFDENINIEKVFVEGVEIE